MTEVRKFRRHFSEQAERLRVMRLDREIGQKELAVAVGKRRAWIAQREGGHRPLRSKDAEALRTALRRLTKEKMGKKTPKMATKPMAEIAQCL